MITKQNAISFFYGAKKHNFNLYLLSSTSNRIIHHFVQLVNSKCNKFRQFNRSSGKETHVFVFALVFDIASRITNTSGEVSPSSLTTSEKSDNPDGSETSNTKNESGESDPGYESDGTKRRLRLQADTNSISSEIKEPKSSLNATEEGKNSTIVRCKDATNYNESFSMPIVIKSGSPSDFADTNEKSETCNNVTKTPGTKNLSYPRNCNPSHNVSNPSVRMFTKHSIVLPQKCNFSEKTDNVRNISVQNVKTIKSGQNMSLKEKSHSNVLVIPIESDVKESRDSPNDEEDIEVTSIFEDIIESANRGNDKIMEHKIHRQNKKQSYVKNDAKRNNEFGMSMFPSKSVLKSKSSNELPNVTMKIFSPVVLDENASLESSKAIQTALSKVDVANLSTSYDFVLGLVKKTDAVGDASTRVSKEVSNRNIQTIARTTNCDKFQTSQPENNFYDAKKKCLGLKRTLSRVKTEINDRKSFLEIIKEIASAIKKLLDSVNNVITHTIDDEEDEKALDLEEKKKDFVRGSKRFSNTLKDYFRNGNQTSVIFASESLIAQVNEIMISLIAIL